MDYRLRRDLLVALMTSKIDTEQERATVAQTVRRLSAVEVDEELAFFKMADPTTAKVRAAACEAELKREWATAAVLYQVALDAYPPTNPKSELANADRESLRRKARSCRAMVASEIMQGEAA